MTRRSGTAGIGGWAATAGAALLAALAASPAAAEVRVERLPDGTRLVRNVAPAARSAAPAPGARGVVRPAAPSDALRELVAGEAARQGVDPRLVEAVVRAESAWDPRAVSRKGAIGLMQLMPATARELAVDPWDAADNVRGGVRYLAGLLARFERLEHALAAYNAGPGAVERHGGVPPYAETRAYVRRVLALYDGREADLGAPFASRGPAPRLVRAADGRMVLTNQPAAAALAARPAPAPPPVGGAVPGATIAVTVAAR